MEDTLRVTINQVTMMDLKVLILVLMEDTLRERAISNSNHEFRVLILVLMEDTLREQRLMFFYIPVFGVCSSF